jgi:hypothetical protein
MPSVMQMFCPVPGKSLTRIKTHTCLYMFLTC